MKKCKPLKKTLIILILSFFIFANTGSIVLALSASDFPIKIHIGKCTYKQPNPVVSNTSKEAGSNYDPNFSLKDPAKGATKVVDYGGESGDAAAINTIAQGEDVVFPRINGITVISLEYLNWAKTLPITNVGSAQQVLLASVALKDITDPKMIKDYYVVMPGSYKQFKTFSSGMSEILDIAKKLNIISETPIDFYAGITYVKPEELQQLYNKIAAEMQSRYPNLLNAIDFNTKTYNIQTIDNVKKAFNLTKDTNAIIYINSEQKKQLDGQLANFASGACYEIRPTGERNLCKNTIKQICPNTANVYFLHGISCEQLNNIFVFPEHSAAINVDTQAYQEKIAPAALKEKTIFKPQVSFGGITTGISLPEYINLIYKYLMGFSLVVTGFVIVIGGAKYMIGSKDGLPMIKNAFIGVLLLSSTYVILKTISPSSVDLSIIDISEIGRKTLTVNKDSSALGALSETAGTATDASKPQPISTGEIIAGCAAPLNTVVNGCVDMEKSEERITDPARMAQLAKNFGSNQGLGLYYNNASQGLATYAGSIPGNFDKKTQDANKKTIYVNLKSATFPSNYLIARKDKKDRTSVFQIVKGTTKSEKIGISCIGFIQAYYSCLGRPFYPGGAHSALVMHGNLITDVNISGDKKSISINGRVLEVGDVIGWVGYQRFNNPADGIAKKAKAALESIASDGSTIAPVAGSTNYSIKIKRTINGKAKVIEHKILGVSHVVLYIGNGEFFDWGAGTVSKLGSSTETGGAVIQDGDLKYHSYVIFLNQLEKNSYEKFKTNKYGVTSCKQLWDKVKAAPDGKYDFYTP